MQCPTVDRAKFALGDSILTLLKVQGFERWYLPESDTTEFLQARGASGWLRECEAHPDRVKGFCVCAVVPVDQKDQWSPDWELPAVVLRYHHQTKTMQQLMPREMKEDRATLMLLPGGPGELRAKLRPFIQTFRHSPTSRTEFQCTFIPQRPQ